MFPAKKLIFLFSLSLSCAINGIAQSSGCTDPSAHNYDASVDEDNGSCCYENWFTVDVSNNAYYLEFVSSTSFNYVGYPFDYGFCAPEGCYAVTVYGYDSQAETLVTILVNGNAVFSGVVELSELTYSGVINFTLGDLVSGCTSGLACNYNPNATCNDGSCIFGCAGCTDTTAPNYNADATIDDGSCCSNENYISVVVTGTDPSTFVHNLYNNGGFWVDQFVGNTTRCYEDGCYTIWADSSFNSDNYFVTVTNQLGQILTSGNKAALHSGISFSINATPGCNDANACNFNPLATCGDFSLCDYGCLGCTDSEAGNFNPNATSDDGSCCYNYVTIVADGPFHWNVSTNFGSYSAYGVYPEQANFCLVDGCFQIYLQNYTGLNAINWSILDMDGNTINIGQLGQSSQIYVISLNAISGCVDPFACNYDPEANCSDYSICNYDCLGCTDSGAPNYNPNATIDNGTCCTENWFTVQADQPGMWYVYSGSNFWWQGGHFPENTGFCQGDGCFSFSFQPDIPTITDLTVIIFDGNNQQIASETTTDLFDQLNFTVSNGGVSGCLDQGACNFDPLANCQEGAFCDYSCYGCTDVTAPNYNPESTIDDGSCCYGQWYTLEFSSDVYWSMSSANGVYQFGQYPQQNGFCYTEDCFHLIAWSIDGSDLTYIISDNNGAVVDSGSIEPYGYGTLISLAESVSGCGDTSACNYNPEVNCNDYYSCDYSCYGCMDPNAPNYDPTATIDDFTCCNSSWFTVSCTSPAYWQVNTPDGYTSGGQFPAENGFCNDGDCFGIYIYALSDEPIGFSILDEEGNEIYMGTAYPGSYYPFSISVSGEISGCTDPYACNYNSDATCFDGTCYYYCGGCMQLDALNFNPDAQFDDGTCFYEIDPPIVGMMMLPDEVNNQFYVLMTMMDTGNGLPYVMSSDYNSQLMMLNESGQYMSGPYPCDSQVEFTLQSLSVGLTTYLTTEMEGACAITISTNEMNASSTLIVYPNPSNGLFFISGITESRAKLSISDMSGRIIKDEHVNISGGKTEVNIDDFSPGVYQVSVITNSSSQTMRLLLSK